MSSLVSWGTRDVNEELNVRIHGSKGAENPFCPFSTTCRAGSWCIDKTFKSFNVHNGFKNVTPILYYMLIYARALQLETKIPAATAEWRCSIGSEIFTVNVNASSFFWLSAVIRNSSSMKH